MLAGDMQGAMNKLHTEDKPLPVKEPPKKEPEAKVAAPVEKKPVPEKKGLFGGIFGKK
jgi:hypothetical protein